MSARTMCRLFRSSSYSHRLRGSLGESKSAGITSVERECERVDEKKRERKKIRKKRDNFAMSWGEEKIVTSDGSRKESAFFQIFYHLRNSNQNFRGIYTAQLSDGV